MAPFQYSPYHNENAVARIGDLMARQGDIAAQGAYATGNALANASLARGNAWSGAVQNIGQSIGAIPQQMQAMQTAQLQQRNIAAQMKEREALATQRESAAKGLAAVDQIMQTSMKTDPETGVTTFDRQAFEKGLAQSGQGHLYPQYAEMLDKLDASAAKRNAEGRQMLAQSLYGVAQHGYTPDAVLSAAAYLKSNHLVTNDHLAPIVAMAVEGAPPEAIKSALDQVSAGLPEYDALVKQDMAQKAALAKTQAETAKSTAEAGKLNAEVAGTLPMNPAQAETARHNLEMERISNLNAGREAAAQAETARHNRAMEAANESAPNLTPDALDLTAKQYAMTGQLPPMGMGKTGAKVRTDIINRAADIYKGLDLPTQVAAYKANQASLGKLQQSADALQAFENTALKNAAVFEDAAKKIIDTGSPLLNKPLRSIDANLLGSTDQAAFNTAQTVVIPEFAKILSNPSLSGQLTDSARHEVETAISPNATLDQIYKTLQVLRTDAANRRESYQQQIGDIQKRIATPPGGSSASVAPKPSERWERGPDGKLRKVG